MRARASAFSITPLLAPLLSAARQAADAPFLVAVSGGGDSLALLLLAHEAFPGRVHAATVDHGLRAGSSAEADEVARWSFGLGIPHRTLRWAGKKPASAIQARAREARYALLARAACEIGSMARPAPVVAAHTREDQAETFVMRLSRGSGLAGLAAMRPVSEIAGAPPVPLLRPLLGVSRGELREFLRVRGQHWIEDPSNEEPRFERVRIRRAIGAGLPAAASLARAAELFGRLEDAMEPQIHRFLARGAVAPAGFASFDLAMLGGEHPATLSRALARLIRAIGGAAYPPDRRSLESLVDKLRRPRFRGATLGGCRLIVHGDTLLIVREARGQPRVVVERGACVLWDRRFFVRSLPDRGPLTVAPLGAAAAGFRGSLNAMPAEAAAVLPGLFADDRLIAPALPGPWTEAPASRFIGLARVELKLSEAWSDWVPA